MERIWYLSPSNQGGNIGVASYGNERDQMYLLMDAIVPHLDRAGISFHVADRTMTLAQRCEESNRMGAYFHFALHSNAGGNGKAWGPVALYYSEAGKEFGQRLVDGLLALGQKSNRSYHLQKNTGLYELRKTAAPAALLEVDFHDSAVGVAFITQRRAAIAEAIARCIIEADGRSFVPVTPGEAAEEAVKLGLMESGSWDAPLTRGEAAQLAIRLKAILEGGGKA